MCKSRASSQKPGIFRLLRRRGRLHQPVWPDEKNPLVAGAGSQRLAEPAAGKQRILDRPQAERVNHRVGFALQVIQDTSTHGPAGPLALAE